MEETNRPANTGDNATEKTGNGESRGRRHGHRGGKRHNKARRENNQGAQQASGTAPSTADAPQKDASTQKREPKNAPQGKADGNKKNDKRNRQKKQNGGRHQDRGRDHIAQKDDIYGDPQEERELAEWRARIVLNSAAAPSPFEEIEDDTPVEIPEGTDLLESPVMQPPRHVEEEQVEVVGIRFRSAGKVYYFDPHSFKLKKGDFAVVETARGPEFGEVSIGNSMVGVSETVSPLRPVIRRATEADIAHNAENREKEKEALVVCQKKIAEHKLEMKLIDVQYAFDNSKLLFYFSSEKRVDFRELVKDLASVFRTRIELRQIGIRDEAKMLGGFGACGRVLCCSTFLPDFAQVSIKMAKEQGLSLNSAKISGMCGRLMCCLRFESEVYAAENKLTPSPRTVVKTPDGIGTVISSNPLAGTIRVVLKNTPDAPPTQYHRNDVTVMEKEKTPPSGDSEKKENS